MKIRTCFGALTPVALAAACGGGLLAALAYVGAIGGFWVAGTQDGANWTPADPSATMSFDTLQPGGVNNLYADPVAEYPVTLSTSLPSQVAQCGDASAGLALLARLDGTAITLSVPNNAQRANCLSGSFVDENTIRLDTGGSGTLFRNALSISPKFEEGAWTNIDRTEQRLRFRNDAVNDGTGLFSQTGCEYSGSTPSGSVVLKYRQGNSNAGVSLSIASIVITRAGGSETWTDGRLYGVSGIQIGNAGGTVSLQRRNETLACN